ncbi:MAG: hypothetical protein FJ290_10910 [Planctomycetes bacterium]|nr:hypothetical protein [Planctomycetota bacterium]
MAAPEHKGDILLSRKAAFGAPLGGGKQNVPLAAGGRAARSFHAEMERLATANQAVKDEIEGWDARRRAIEPVRARLGKVCKTMEDDGLGVDCRRPEQGAPPPGPCHLEGMGGRTSRCPHPRYSPVRGKLAAHWCKDCHRVEEQRRVFDAAREALGQIRRDVDRTKDEMQREADELAARVAGLPTGVDPRKEADLARSAQEVSSVDVDVADARKAANQVFPSLPAPVAAGRPAPPQPLPQPPPKRGFFRAIIGFFGKLFGLRK